MLKCVCYTLSPLRTHGSRDGPVCGRSTSNEPRNVGHDRSRAATAAARDVGKHRRCGGRRPLCFGAVRTAHMPKSKYLNVHYGAQCSLTAVGRERPVAYDGLRPKAEETSREKWSFKQSLYPIASRALPKASRSRPQRGEDQHAPITAMFFSSCVTTAWSVGTGQNG